MHNNNLTNCSMSYKRVEKDGKTVSVWESIEEEPHVVVDVAEIKSVLKGQTQQKLDDISDRIGDYSKATDAEYTAFRAHLQDEIDELLTPIEEEESNE